MRLLNCLAFGLILSTSLTSSAVAVEPDAPETLISRLEAVGFEVQQRLAAPFHDATEYAKRERGALVEYYADHKPIWVDENGLTAKAKAIIAEIARADANGLNVADYNLPDASIEVDGEAPAAAGLANAELQLSHAVIDYARDARGGRIDPSKLSGYLDPTIELPDPYQVMTKIAAEADPAAYLRGFHPQHPQFEALRKKLVELRGGNTPKVEIPATGPVLKPGDSHPDIALLRERLEVADSEDDRGEDFGPAVAEALRDFQRAHGLTPDAILGPATRRVFQSRPANRIKTILVNMERWRWVPRDLGRLNVNVNVPEYLVRVSENGKIIHTERTVVGKLRNQTPIFSDQMEYIDFNPYWNVPNSIKQEEILPYLVRDTGGFFGFGGGTPRVLERHNLRVKYNGRPIDPGSVDWQRVDIRRFHFYQPPGGPNVLGVVKFMFPNKHAVYLHDTPTKNLFGATTRAYSHGCVRVRDPLKLAEILLSRDSGWSMSRIKSAVAAGSLQTVRFKSPIPVHITYFTAHVDEDGNARYFGDVYRHDSRIAAALKL